MDFLTVIFDVVDIMHHSDVYLKTAAYLFAFKYYSHNSIKRYSVAHMDTGIFYEKRIANTLIVFLQ